MENIHSDYLSDALSTSGVKFIIKKAVDELSVIKKKYPNKNIGVVFTGMSGAVIAPVVAYELGFYTVVVRKSGASTHSSAGIEGIKDVDAWFIVDDFIETGRTLNRVIKKMKTFFNGTPDFLGVWFYISHYSNRQEILAKKNIHCLNDNYFGGRYTSSCIPTEYKHPKLR